MLVLYIVFGLFLALLFSATVCGVFKMGEKENICNYGYLEEDKKQ